MVDPPPHTLLSYIWNRLRHEAVRLEPSTRADVFLLTLGNIVDCSEYSVFSSALAIRQSTEVELISQRKLN